MILFLFKITGKETRLEGTKNYKKKNKDRQIDYISSYLYFFIKKRSTC